MRSAIRAQHDDHHYHLPHQALWFVLMLLTMLLLWSKTAVALL